MKLSNEHMKILENLDIHHASIYEQRNALLNFITSIQQNNTQQS